MPLPLGRYLCGRGHRSTAIVARWGQSCPALGCAGVGPACGSRPGNRSAEHEVRLEARSEDVCAVGDPWSKQPVAPSAESGVDQSADSGAAVGSLVWRPVGKTRLVRSLGVILRRWGGPAVAASAGEAAAPGARTFGAVFAPRSS